MKYDYVIVGCGLFGATFAQLAKESNKTVLIVEKRNHIGGNCYTRNDDGIEIHQYGPHIFHTNNETIWKYVNRFTSFNKYINRPKVSIDDKIYSFPINLMTLHQLWGVTNPTEAKLKLDTVKIKIDNPSNLEEWVLSQVGEEIYYKFIYGYTKKQWNTEPKNLPSFIIKRLPIRLNFDDNYFFDQYQGIPENGYTSMINNMLDGIDIELGIDYFENRNKYDDLGQKVVFTGPIDKFFNHKYGKLPYRSLKFETQKINISDFQGNAIVNYTKDTIPYTRIVEHKHFNIEQYSQINHTVITKEFPVEFEETQEPYYPINNNSNNELYNKYNHLSKQESKYIFGGRLAEYQYYDMHQVIASAIKTFNKQS